MKRLLLVVAVVVAGCNDTIPGECKNISDCPPGDGCFSGFCAPAQYVDSGTVDSGIGDSGMGDSGMGDSGMGDWDVGAFDASVVVSGAGDAGVIAPDAGIITSDAGTQLDAGCGALTACNDLCVDTTSDSKNCSACGYVCAVGSSCKASQCRIDCPSHWGDCDGKADNGCETNLLTSDANCSACNNPCGEYAHCDAGACVYADKRIFVTSAIYKGNLGGLTGADAICQTHAAQASLGGAWKAWLSDTTTDVSARLYHWPGRFVRVDGAIIAESWDVLTTFSSKLQNTISLTEQGSVPPQGTLNCSDKRTAWTASDPRGFEEGFDCNGWTGGPGQSGTVGDWAQTSWYWSYYCNSSDCGNDEAPLYCVEQP